MTPHRSHGRGTLVLKMRFRGLRRIERATGTQDVRVLEAMRRMCATLYDQGRLDVLEAIAGGRLLLMQVYDRYRRGRLADLPRADLIIPLRDQWQGWLTRADVAPETARSRAKALKALSRHLPEAATAAELAAALRAYRVAAAMHHRAFNDARAACLAYVRDHLGHRDAIYAAVQDVPTLKRTGKARAPRPLAIEALRRIMRSLNEAAAQRGSPARPGSMAWAMAVTGMGPKEYFDDGFTVEADRILVHGQKRAGRERVVPRAALVERPTMSRERWEKVFRAGAPGYQPYDLRRTFANLLVEAGIPSNRRRHYMGHGARTMTELYERTEIDRWLVEDGAALALLLGEPPRHLTLQREA